MGESERKEEVERFKKQFQPAARRVDHFRTGVDAARHGELPLTYSDTNSPEYMEGYEYGRYVENEGK